MARQVEVVVADGQELTLGQLEAILVDGADAVLAQQSDPRVVVVVEDQE
jgi:hypothetical protein